MKLIGITGLAGAGKDTVGNYLVNEYRFTRLAFADPLKKLCELAYPYLAELVKVYGWDEVKKQSEYRELLQRLGNGARELFGDNFWVDQAMKKIAGKTVVTDCRYINEFEAIKSRGGIIVRIVRPGLDPVNNHITETGHLSLPAEYTIINDSTIDDLYDRMSNIIVSEKMNAGLERCKTCSDPYE